MTGMPPYWREALAGATPVAVAGTLVCCALPITLVSLGAGGVLASLVSSAPWLVTLTRHKEWIFVGAAALLVVDYWALFRSARTCERDDICHPAHALGRWLRRIYWGSVAAYAIGFAAAYLSLPLARALGR